MAEVKKDQWQGLLESTRAGYEKSVKVLTDLQQEIEKTINTLVQKGTEFSEDSAKLVKDWIEKNKKIAEDFQKEAEGSLKKVMSLMPDYKSFDFPFKKEFEDMSKKIEEQIKKAFDAFKLA